MSRVSQVLLTQVLDIFQFSILNYQNTYFAVLLQSVEKSTFAVKLRDNDFTGTEVWGVCGGDCCGG